jgi:hypothetical protein
LADDRKSEKLLQCSQKFHLLFGLVAAAWYRSSRDGGLVGISSVCCVGGVSGSQLPGKQESYRTASAKQIVPPAFGLPLPSKLPMSVAKFDTDDVHTIVNEVNGSKD